MAYSWTSRILLLLFPCFLALTGHTCSQNSATKHLLIKSGLVGVFPSNRCHKCDMSVSLVFSTTVPLQEVLYPQCQTHFLEHMESINPDSPNQLTLQQQLTTDIDLNSLQFDYGCEGNDPSNSVASGLDNSSSVGMRMNSVEISESLSQESCAICKDEFSLHSEAKQLPCNHLYHSECILPWLSHQSSCPLCRFQLPMINPSNVVSWACSSSYFQ